MFILALNFTVFLLDISWCRQPNKLYTSDISLKTEKRRSRLLKRCFQFRGRPIHPVCCNVWRRSGEIVTRKEVHAGVHVGKRLFAEFSFSVNKLLQW